MEFIKSNDEISTSTIRRNVTFDYKSSYLDMEFLHTSLIHFLLYLFGQCYQLRDIPSHHVLQEGCYIPVFFDDFLHRM